jgi:hypothetical protein
MQYASTHTFNFEDGVQVRGFCATPRGYLLSTMVTMKTRVLAGLSALLIAVSAGCSGSRPSSQGGPGPPVPAATLHRLPAGVFYFLAGWPNIYSANVWEVTPAGREVQLTHNQEGFGVSWFSASHAGIVMADASTGADELARLTTHGAQWLPAGHTRQPEIGGSAPQIASNGAITYVVPPANYGPAHNDNALWVTSSFSSRGRIIYKQRDDLAGEAFGPGGQIAVMNRPGDPPFPGIHAHLLIISPAGLVKTVPTPFWSLATVIWQPNAVALAVSSVTNQIELIYPGGRTELLQRGWQPLSWDPAGNELLVQRGLLLGLWSVAAPRAMTVLGKTNRQFAVLNVDWLAGRAPL